MVAQCNAIAALQSSWNSRGGLEIWFPRKKPRWIERKWCNHQEKSFFWWKSSFDNSISRDMIHRTRYAEAIKIRWKWLFLVKPILISTGYNARLDLSDCKAFAREWAKALTVPWSSLPERPRTTLALLPRSGRGNNGLSFTVNEFYCLWIFNRCQWKKNCKTCNLNSTIGTMH